MMEYMFTIQCSCLYYQAKILLICQLRCWLPILPVIEWLDVQYMNIGWMLADLNIMKKPI